MGNDFMEKRINKRILFDREIIFSTGDVKRFGTLTNCSETGMYIKNKLSSPFDSVYEVLIPMEKDVLKVPVKVVRVDKSDYFHEGVGVELMGYPPKYLEFVKHLEFITNDAKDDSA